MPGEKEPSVETILPRDLQFVVSRWIGVSSGYLDDFDIHTLRNFLIIDCEVEPDLVDAHATGTKRQIFGAVLRAVDSSSQARIVEGVLGRFPLGSTPAEGSEAVRSEGNEKRMRLIIDRLQGGTTAAVEIPAPRNASPLVGEALLDARRSIGEDRAWSAIDRLHTALHAYLIDVCKTGGIQVKERTSAGTVLSLLREQHPELKNLSKAAKKTLRGLNLILDGASDARNQESLAHPGTLAEADQALLIVNAMATVFTFIDGRLAETIA